jgi:hypothetical protein
LHHSQSAKDRSSANGSQEQNYRRNGSIRPRLRLRHSHSSGP